MEKFITVGEQDTLYSLLLMSGDNYTSLREKIEALGDVARYDPTLSIGIVVLALIAATLEGVGLGFILPVIETIQSGTLTRENADGVLLVFIRVY